jgi:hypothetical protein
MYFIKHWDDEKTCQFWSDTRTAIQIVADKHKGLAHQYAINYGLFLLGELENYELQKM